MTATLRDVAARCGTSIHTVSKVLGGKPGFAVDTRARVLAAAHALGYRPSAFARAVRSGRTGQIGLLSGTGAPSFHIPPSLLGGLVDGLQRHGLHLLPSRLPEPTLADGSALPSVLDCLHVDGVLVNYQFAVPPAMQAVLDKNALPALWLNTLREHDCVRPDDHGAGQQLATHLLALGHRRIAYVDQLHHGGPNDHYSAEHRRAGCAEALRAAGLELRCVVGFANEQGRAAAARALIIGPGRPTAVISYAGPALLPVWLAAMAAGMQVPRDLALATFEDEGIESLDGTPARAINPWSAVGRCAADEIVHRLRDGAARTAVTVPFTLLPGRCLPPPSGEPS